MMNKLCYHFLRTIKLNSFKNYSPCVALGRNFCFKSDLSLEFLYPNSAQKLFTPTPPQNNNEKFNGFIPINQLEITYSRSSGPGGQNVNCVNTKVDLRFNIKLADWISNDTKNKIMEKHKTKISKEGYLIIKSDVTRSQHMNLADALEKLRNIIRDSEKPEMTLSEATLEKIRRSQEKSARERLLVKRLRSQTKSDRQSPSGDY